MMAIAPLALPFLVASSILNKNVALAQTTSGGIKSVQYRADLPSPRLNPKDFKPDPNAHADPTGSFKFNSDVIPFIVGGENATFQEHPFFVWMGFCGGSLVWEDIVLTSARCNGGSNKGGIVTVGPSQTGVTVEREVVNPFFSDFFEEEKFWDFDILKIANTVDGAVPITLENSADNPEDNEELVAIGLGSTSADDEAWPDMLQKVTLNYFPNDLCQDLLYGIYDIADDHLCAGILEEGAKVCYGDIGGPLVDGDRLVGVTSFGQGCALPYRPGVFARVSSAYDWIYSHICCLSDNPPSDCGDFDLNMCPVTCDSGSTLMRLDLITDEYPAETSWTVINECTEELVASSQDFGNYNSSNTYFLDQLCLPDGYNYTFTIFDSGNDGLCCTGGVGQYKLSYDDYLYQQGEDFGSYESTSFGSCDKDPEPAGCDSCDQGKCSNSERCLFRVCDRESDAGAWKCYERYEESGVSDPDDECTLNTHWTWNCEECNFRGEGENCCMGCTRAEPRTDCQACDQELCAGYGFHGRCLYVGCNWVRDGLHQCSGHVVVDDNFDQTCYVEEAIYQCSSCSKKNDQESCCDGCTRLGSKSSDRVPYGLFDLP